MSLRPVLIVPVFCEGVMFGGSGSPFLVLTVRVLVADRARLVLEVVDTPFAKADIEAAVSYGVACLLGGDSVQILALVAMSYESRC